MEKEKMLERIYEVMAQKPKRLWNPLWMPVMIWDVLQRCNTKWGKFVYAVFHSLAPLWVDMSQSINEQDIDCIEYVNSLI